MGAKRMYAMGVFISSLATIALSSLYYLENISFPLIVALRILIGAAHGALFPVTYTLWAKWAVPDERGTLISLSFSGSNIGTCKNILYL
jgi:predicted MFS family arabinose efflux permease